jgi:hypothetical protein
VQDTLIGCGNGDADIAVFNGGALGVADPVSLACEM